MRPHIGSEVNLLRWSFFTFIYNRSSNMNYSIYTSHHFTSHGKIWTQLIDLAPNVWLHSSVGRASHRYRGGHGFESRWSPDFFFQASSFQLLKLENLLRWSYFTLIIIMIVIVVAVAVAVAVVVMMIIIIDIYNKQTSHHAWCKCSLGDVGICCLYHGWESKKWETVISLVTCVCPVLSVVQI